MGKTLVVAAILLAGTIGIMTFCNKDNPASGKITVTFTNYDDEPLTEFKIDGNIIGNGTIPVNGQLSVDLTKKGDYTVS